MTIASEIVESPQGSASLDLDAGAVLARATVWNRGVEGYFRDTEIRDSDTLAHALRSFLDLLINLAVYKTTDNFVGKDFEQAVDQARRKEDATLNEFLQQIGATNHTTGGVKPSPGQSD